MRKLAGLLLLFMILIVGIQPARVNADGGTNQIDITVSDIKTQKAVPNVSISIYQVAEGTPTALQMAEAFSDAEVQIEDFAQSSNLEMITQTLEAYLVKQKIEPQDTRVSDDAGKIIFSGLENGIYLIRQSEASDSGYDTPAFLISAPKMDENGNFVSYIKCHPKGTLKEEVSQMVVNKIWKDTNESESRPSSITVGLYKDGKLTEQVQLNAQMNWHYEWKNLDAGAEWTVKELNIPKGYVSSIKTVGGVCTITNTKEKTPPVTKTVKSVKTGDHAKIVCWIALIIIALCGIGIITRKIRMNNKNE